MVYPGRGSAPLFMDRRRYIGIWSLSLWQTQVIRTFSLPALPGPSHWCVLFLIWTVVCIIPAVLHSKLEWKGRTVFIRQQIAVKQASSLHIAYWGSQFPSDLLIDCHRRAASQSWIGGYLMFREKRIGSVPGVQFNLIINVVPPARLENPIPQQTEEQVRKVRCFTMWPKIPGLVLEMGTLHNFLGHILP